MTLFASSNDELKKQDIDNLNKVIFYASQCEYIDTLYQYLKNSGVEFGIHKDFHYRVTPEGYSNIITLNFFQSTESLLKITE